MRERQLGEPGDHFGAGRVVRADARLDVGLVHGAIPELPVDEPGGVPQQVLHGRRPLRRDQRELAAAGGRVGHLDADLHVLQLGQIGRDRLVQQHPSLLDQLHRRHRRHRLAHRRQAEQRASGHRRPLGRGGIAECPLVNESAVAGDHHDRPRDLAVVDARLVTPVERAEAIERNAFLVGGTGRGRLRLRHRCPGREDGCGRESNRPAQYASHR
jgi:hypothetical protein